MKSTEVDFSEFLDFFNAINVLSKIVKATTSDRYRISNQSQEHLTFLFGRPWPAAKEVVISSLNVGAYRAL